MNADLMPFLRRMDLNLLVTFDVLMRTGSATEAAQLLNKTQPGVSRDLSRLREIFSDPLLVWNHGHFQPTERALELHPTVREALSTLEAAFRPPESFNPAHASGVVNIGLGAHLETVLAGPLLRILAQKAPDVIPRLHPVHGAFDPDQIDNKQLDIAIGLFRNIPKRINAEVLFSDTRVAVMSKNHPLAHRAEIELQHLMEYRFFAFSNMFQQRTNFDEALKRTGFQLPFSAYLSGFGITGYVLEESDYVTTMPYVAAQAHIRHFNLIHRQLPSALQPVTFYMIWPRRLESDPLVNWVITLLKEVTAQEVTNTGTR
ncbi:LysR family transcriptional regulator [Thalassospira marina]|uniref:LysR family transcriptional regulator n=1 Tax=Thalassospira marina TaxID=2048283 RepID=A0A2N3KT92_9PROT|nr:LysR family transcriptional regulator [Thalassospira marina]PKR53730.1 LysR family transcriptional regulator [Thalassospira marina]